MLSACEIVATVLVVVSSLSKAEPQIGTFDYYDFDSDQDVYTGKYIGELSTYHHQVTLIL